MNPPEFRTAEGRLVRDILAEADRAEAVTIVGDTKLAACPFHPQLERRIAAQGTALTFMSEWIGDLRNGGGQTRTDMIQQHDDILALKLRMALYSAIGAIIASPILVGVTLLLVKQLWFHNVP